LVIDRYGFELRNDDEPGEIAESMSCNPYFNENAPDRSELDGPWQRLFVDCVKGKKQPPLSLEESHRGTVCCHLANISYLAGRRIRWNGETESIPEDKEAATLLDRPRRDKYKLPEG
jgi:hypothetical protein